MHDLISRQDAIDAMVEILADATTCMMPKDLWREVVTERISNLPSAQRTGEWEEVEVIADVYDISGVKTWASRMKCDQCGFRHTAIEGHMAQYNFCPNCGSYNGGKNEVRKMLEDVGNM